MRSSLFKPPQMPPASLQHNVSLEDGLVFPVLSTYSSAHVEKAGDLPKGTSCFSEFQFIDIAKETEANEGCKKKWTREENLTKRKNQLALIQKKKSQLQL